MIQTKILEYRKKYNLTSWNAFMKLTEHKHFKELMRHWFNNKRKSMKAIAIRKRLNREDLEEFMRNEPSVDRNFPMYKFYMNHILRGSKGIEKLLKTKPTEYTRRKKRK